MAGLSSVLGGSAVVALMAGPVAMLTLRRTGVSKGSSSSVSSIKGSKGIESAILNRGSGMDVLRALGKRGTVPLTIVLHLRVGMGKAPVDLKHETDWKSICND